MAAIVPSVCPLDCPDTCSLSITVDGGRVTRVDGSDLNPYTGGFICAKVRRYPERVYSPLRIMHPQRRAGAKGEGRFERISWEEAIATIVARWQAIIAESGAQSIVPYHYGGSSGVFGEDAIDARFFNRLGAAHLLKTICAAPTGAVYTAMYGGMGGVPPQDYEHARAILLWGVNPSATSIHFVPKVQQAKRRGAFLAVIDPRRTPLARIADVHLRPRPGTDVVLALSMIDALVRSGRVAADFVSQWVNGFEALAAAARQYPIERAAEICDVAAADIARVVDAYAAVSPAVVRCGWGVERNRNGGNAVRAILSLPAVAGKFGVRGGGMTMSLSRAIPIDKAALARPQLRDKPAHQVNMNHLGRVLTQPQRVPVRSLFVYNSNPVAVAPNQALVVRGLQREDLFTVVHEQVMTDTARYADILLPAPSFLEQPDLCKSYGHYYVQYAEPVIARIGEALSNVELFEKLAEAMGFGAAVSSGGVQALMQAALPAAVRERGLDAATLQQEKIASLRFAGSDELVQFGNEFPKTASGKIEIDAPDLGPIGYRFAADSYYPLALITPASAKSINSILAEVTMTRITVSMHPEDAARRGVADGDAVRVFNELASVELPAKLSRDIRPGVVSIPKGAWCMSTLNGLTANALVPDYLTDIGGGACFNDARVEIEKRGTNLRRSD